MELTMENNTTSEEVLRAMVRERVHKMSRFYTHLFVYAIGLVIYLAKTYFGAPLNFIPFRYINCTFMYVWTFILVVQGLRLLVREKILDTRWEQKKINEIMEKEKKNNTNKWA